MSIDASIFMKKNGTHLKYLETAYGFLIESYRMLKDQAYDAIGCNENKIRDDLVKIAKAKKNPAFPFRWITEYPDIDKSNRIDIDLATPLSLIDESNAIKIECKIVGEDKYIDTYVSLTRQNSPTNGIMSFISGKYAEKMPLAGMIGFIKEGNICLKIDKVKKRIDTFIKNNTIQNLKEYTIDDNFPFSYRSTHSRYNQLPNINIYIIYFLIFSKAYKNDTIVNISVKLQKITSLWVRGCAYYFKDWGDTAVTNFFHKP